MVGSFGPWVTGQLPSSGKSVNAGVHPWEQNAGKSNNPQKSELQL